MSAHRRLRRLPPIARRARPGSAPRGGTAIGDAIRKALEVFQARADRDQAILLITDGDDQQSYPLEAAAVAAERHVTIFTVGLGDADHGAHPARARNPNRTSSTRDSRCGASWTARSSRKSRSRRPASMSRWEPAPTIWENCTRNTFRAGAAAKSKAANGFVGRTSSRFSSHWRFWPCWPMRSRVPTPVRSSLRSRDSSPAPAARAEAGARARHPALPVSTALVLVASLAGTSRADNPAEAVREGLRWYGKGEFDKARDKFAAAREQFDSGDAGKAAIAAFDQACALHRKGDVAQAREWYLKAGLAHDKGLAASAHFNLGTLAAEEARRLAGEQPENVAPEKRQEILDQLKAAVASFRHCLELQPDNSRARRDIELVRQWIKYYTDQWLAHDREKRRQETNLVAFLEFLIETQRALRESVKALPATAPADAFAEPKRLQDELQEEIPPLKEKIKTELTPQPSAGGECSARQLERAGARNHAAARLGERCRR